LREDTQLHSRLTEDAYALGLLNLGGAGDADSKPCEGKLSSTFGESSNNNASKESSSIPLLCPLKTPPGFSVEFHSKADSAGTGTAGIGTPKA